jgi:hypothetical protein
LPVDEAAAESRCERCGGRFHCGANDAAPCACTTITLDAATLARLRATYEGCLCLRCLAELAAGGGLSPSAAVDGR